MATPIASHALYLGICVLVGLFGWLIDDNSVRL